jgi:hypothetical protein
MDSFTPVWTQTDEFAALAEKLKQLSASQNRKLNPFELMVLLADRATPNKKEPSELYGAEFHIPDDKVRAAWGLVAIEHEGLSA